MVVFHAFDLRIFRKTVCVLAVLVILAGLGSKAPEWTKTLDSSFIVYGRSSFDHVITSSVTDNRSAGHVFAQVADGRFRDGSGYRSTLVVQSDAPVAVSCAATLVGLTIPGLGDGTTFPVGVTPGGISIVETPGTQDIKTGSMTLECSKPVTAQLLYSLRSSDDTVLAEATVFSSPPALVAELVADQRNGVQLGIAVANVSNRYKNLLLVAIDSTGTEVNRTTVTLGPRIQVAKFLSEFMSVPADFVGTVRVSEPQGFTADTYAIGLKYTGNAFTTIPAMVRSVTITGTVRNALTGSALSGAIVRILATGASTTTDYNGQFTVMATGASADLQVSSSAFLTTLAPVDLRSGTPVVQNVSLSTALPAGEYRFTLNWTKDSAGRPDDLDLHLIGPTSTGSCFEVSSQNPGSATSSPFAQLEVDNLLLLGHPPLETIHISGLVTGRYTLFVHDHGGELTNGLDLSRATVQVFGVYGLVMTNFVASGNGPYWNILSISVAQDGKFGMASILTRTSEPPTGCQNKF